MNQSKPGISIFPKCYFDALVTGEMDYIEWIHRARALGAEGLEHYDGFFKHLAPERIGEVVDAMAETGQITSMLCFSPDFTHPDQVERRRQVERQKRAIDLCVQLGTPFCRTLSGQRYPQMSRQVGIERTLDGIRRSLDYAEQQGVILCMENHYKDGTWEYSEFAQPREIFLEIIQQIDSPNFGVQFDPSNATVGGFDPIEFLGEVKHRIVTVHASDRYLTAGTTLEDLRQADGSTGYLDQLIHGQTGKGLNDYDAIFRILSEVGFGGWISVEDGMNGMDELQRSVEFLKGMRLKYYGE